MSRPRIYWAFLVVGILPFYFNGYVNARIATQSIAYWSFELFCWVLLPLAVFGALVRLGYLRMADIGLHGRIAGRPSVAFIILISVLLCAADYLVHTGAFNYFRTVLPGDGLFQYQSVLPPPGTSRTLVALYFALTAGIVEELYFRGLALRACETLPHRNTVYLLISPLLFALIHWESGPATTAAAYVFGILHAAAFLVLRNLWPPIAAHVCIDYVKFS